MAWRLKLSPITTCLRGKERYHTRSEAEGVRGFLISIGDHQPERGPLETFWCNQCSAWHLGHGTTPQASA